MKNFMKSHVPAKDLMEDDRFKMGGAWYRIETVRVGRDGFVDISFYPAAYRSSLTAHHQLTVRKFTMFKIYNLKSK